MPDFAVLRIAKITSLASLAGASAHNTRTAVSGFDHADNRAPRMEGGARLLEGHGDAVEAWRARTKEVELGKVRKDAVRALEAVLSASPEWFSKASPEDRGAWVAKSMEWACRTFKAENILQATLHDDEETPHIHILAVPLVQKQRKKSGRPRKRGKNLSTDTARSWGLSASDLIGGREKLTALQTSYAAEVADLGIRRGLPRRTTGARHRSANAYRSEAAEDRFSAAVSLADAEATARGTILFAEIEAQQIRTEAQSNATRLASAFTAGLDAIDAGELVYRPGNDDRPSSLRREHEKTVHLPRDREAFRVWKEAIQPVVYRLVGYARRLSQLTAREREINTQSEDMAIEGAAIRRTIDRQVAWERASGAMVGPAQRDAVILARSRSKRTDRGIAR